MGGPLGEKPQGTRCSLGYSSGEKKMEPSGEACGVGIIQRMGCASQRAVREWFRELRRK